MRASRADSPVLLLFKQVRVALLSSLGIRHTQYIVVGKQYQHWAKVAFSNIKCDRCEKMFRCGEDLNNHVATEHRGLLVK